MSKIERWCDFFALFQVHKACYNNSSSFQRKSNFEARIIDVGELKAMLPQGDGEKKKDDGTFEKNHKINGEVCLLIESPFRILRVSLDILTAETSRINK